MIFNFHLYGFLIGLGILASASASAWLARRRGINPDLIWNGLWWVMVPGLIGARLYHVADRWSDIYRLDPVTVLYIWNGGLGIFGGLAGGFIGLWLYKRFTNYDLRFMNILDMVFFGLPLGQAIGRIGNFVNQEIYGLPTNLPWGIYINPENRLPEFQNFSRFHPLFGYETVWNLTGFAIMLLSEKKHFLIRRSYSGFYLVWYGLGRFGLDFLRPQEFSWFIGNLNLSQLSSLILIAAGLFIWNKSPLITANR
ncbi:MAG: Prolipoprotein diacylglyceryl transferase [Candidatus Magasanikbacteria bacterium GW2011_GWA2_42_32]|uniref:Phosphatidylglycerol--prolipoprotein diacylglyceryl transferase n=1 Tax=Candidatus Magasanikbacteria bacterium GW2011_GWA2_42_32 TaxID=1619039 RepID=A0A0G1D132_9BACT|nr:MAG: Prolipoprotein diacylglyceryl transferase [Candidatus Magasanikbacteria bacterium GW2011_GWA2_42_32]